MLRENNCNGTRRTPFSNVIDPILIVCSPFGFLILSNPNKPWILCHFWNFRFCCISKVAAQWTSLSLCLRIEPALTPLNYGSTPVYNAVHLLSEFLSLCFSFVFFVLSCLWYSTKKHCSRHWLAEIDPAIAVWLLLTLAPFLMYKYPPDV